MTSLVGDIGGTNARFALVDASAPHDLIDSRHFKCADFPTIDDAIARYLSAIGGPRPDRAVLALACPIMGDQVIQNNGPWRFSITALKARLGLRDLQVVNDFVAMAHGVASLPNERFSPIGPVGLDDAATEGPWVVVGPGTGLGAAVVLNPRPPVRVLESEGGHLGLAPSDFDEIEITRSLLRRHGTLSWELVLSGPGLALLHSVIAELHERPAEPLTPEEILRRGLEASDPDCRAALDRFCLLLGAAAGDMALMVRARRVCLVGGIVQAALPYLRLSGFRDRFVSRGRYGEVLDHVPTLAALGTDVGILGAAVLAA